MPFNILSSLQSEAQKFEAPAPPVTYNTFNHFINKSSATPSGVGSGQALAAGQCSAMSFDGQYILYTTTTTNQVALSTDYGVSFSLITLSSGITNCCMTGTGQYQYVITNVTSNTSNFWYSADFGSTWNSVNVNTGGKALRGMACSYEDYRYVALGAGAQQSAFYYSADGGASFTKITGAPYTQQGYEVSDDGNIVYVLGNLSGTLYTVIYKFTNMLTDPNTVNSTPTIDTSFYTSTIAQSQNDLVVSSNGQYILTANNTSLFSLLSTDFGATWSQINMFAASGRSNPAISRNGKYMIVSVNGRGVKYSNDYGSTWTAVVNGDFNTPPSALTTTWNSCAMDKYGKKAFLVTQVTTAGSNDKAFIATATN